MSENTKSSFLCENSSKGNKGIAWTLTAQTIPLSTGYTSRHLIWVSESRAMQYKLQDVYFLMSFFGQEEWLNSQGGPSFVLCSCRPDAHLETPLESHVDTAPLRVEGLAVHKHGRRHKEPLDFTQGANSCSSLPAIPPRSHSRSRAKPDGISPQAGFGLQLELSDFIVWS